MLKVVYSVVYSIAFFSLPLLAYGKIFDASLESQYSFSHLKWRTQNTGVEVLRQANWQNIQALEFNVKSCYRPSLQGSFFGCPLDAIALEVQGGLVLSSPSNSFKGSFSPLDCQYKLDYSPFKKSSFHGYEFTCAFMLEDFLMSNVQLQTSFGYGLKERSLNAPCQVLIARQQDPIFIPLSIEDMRYKVWWQGPWIGSRLTFIATKNTTFFGQVIYQRAIFQGRGSWLEKEAFRDGFSVKRSLGLRQKGLLHIFKGKIGACYNFSTNWQAYFSGDIELFQDDKICGKSSFGEQWQAQKGHMIGNSQSKQAANYSLTWHSWAISGGMTYVF